MSNATKCDRCGGFYEKGGKNVCRQGYGVVATDFDLCPDCAESFDAWLERGQMADASERVTNDGEMLHDTREKLEADVRRKQREWSQSPCALDTNFYEVIGWLDRQAAITERECMERTTSERIGFDCAECAEGLGRELEARCYHLKARIAELRAERDEWKTKCETREFAYKQADAERKRYSEQIDELLAERNEWNGLAEKYRADSIAAQEAAAEMAQRIQTLELEIAKRDKGIERLKKRRGELTEQLGAMADRMAKNGR